MRRSARRSTLLASLLLAPRETAAAACGDGTSHLRDWLCQLTVSWPDSTLVASTEGRTELLYLSLAGSVCSQIRLGAVSSSRSRLENATELSAKFTGFDLQCDMDGLAVSDKPPIQRPPVRLPLSLGEDLYAYLSAVKGMPTGLKFHLRDAAFAIRLLLSEGGPPERRLPKVEVTGVDVSIDPRLLDISLHEVYNPLHIPFADSFMNAGMSAFKFGWGIANAVNQELLQELTSYALRAVLLEQILPSTVAQVGEILAGLSSTQRIHLPEPEDLPPESFRWSESEIVASAVIASNSALGGSNGTRVVVPTTLGGPKLGGKEWTIFGDDGGDGVERPSLGINRIARLFTDDASGVIRAPAFTLGQELSMLRVGGTARAPFNLSVELEDWFIGGLDTFSAFGWSTKDNYSLAFDFALETLTFGANAVFIVEPSTNTSSIISHATGVPLRLASTVNFALSDIRSSGALLLALNATHILRSQLRQLIQPLCVAEAIIAGTLRSLRYEVDASASVVSFAQPKLETPDKLAAGIIQLVSDFVSAGLDEFDSIIEGVVSGASRAPLVSLVNNLTSTLLAYLPPETVGCTPTLAVPLLQPPPQVDWREEGVGSLQLLLDRALEWLDAKNVVSALRTLGLTGVRVPGEIMEVSSDLLQMSQLGVGEIRVALHDMVLHGLDTLSLLEVLRSVSPPPELPTALDSRFNLTGGDGVVEVTIGTAVTMFDRLHEFDVRIALRDAQMSVRLLLDIWHGLLPLLELRQLLSTCVAVPLIQFEFVADASFFEAAAVNFTMQPPGATTPAAVRGASAISAANAMATYVARIFNDQLRVAVTHAHAACAAEPNSSYMRPFAKFRAEERGKVAPLTKDQEDALKFAFAYFEGGNAVAQQLTPGSVELDGAETKAWGATGLWGVADIVCSLIGVSLFLLTLIGSWTHWRRTRRSSPGTLRGPLARYLPCGYARRLSVAMAITMLLLAWTRAQPWPELALSLTVAGDPIGEIHVYQFLSIPGHNSYVAKFLADGEWYLAVPLYLVSGIWPYAKLCLAMMLLHAPPSIISLRLRGRLLEGSNFMAKWAKVHMDIVSLLLVMVTLNIVIGDGNACDAFPLATATTSVDPRWQAYQICVLYAATILSQMVMVAHYEAYEATAASNDAATSARGAFPPPSPLRSLAIALGEAATSRPSARPTTPVSRGTGGAGAPPVERTLSAAEAARPAEGEIAPVEEAPDGGGVTPGARAVRTQQKWLRDREKSWARGTELSAARTTAGSEVEPMEALCRLPIRVWPMTLPARPSLLARLGLVGGVLCCLTALSVGWVTPLFTVQLAGLPRLVVGDERDRTYSLWGVVTTLGEAARRLPVVMVVTQASFFVATFLAPVVIQLLALTLWLKPMTARARRAVGLAVRLVYAWCGLDVICVLLLSMAILPVNRRRLIG